MSSSNIYEYKHILRYRVVNCQQTFPKFLVLNRTNRFTAVLCRSVVVSRVRPEPDNEFENNDNKWAERLHTEGPRMWSEERGSRHQSKYAAREGCRRKN